MITSLKLVNFRCFRDHEFEFGDTNVAVGLNNAGKSTLAEALRIVSIASSRLKNLAYRDPPNWLLLPKSQCGCSFSMSNLQIDFDRFFNHYREPPATIRARFSNNSELRIYIGGPGKTHCVVVNGAGHISRTQTAARRCKIPSVDALPQVGPVAIEEKILSPDYVMNSLSSRLAPIHFRNQLNLLYDLFADFQAAVESTWGGLRVVELTGQGGKPQGDLYLQIRDGDFVGEVSTMGHGVQMWLQTIWFLVRSRASDTLILDEPDVYMHADLQRKLIRYLRGLKKQVIVTTHSTEIMSEVSPEDVVVVDRDQPVSRRASSLPAVQSILANLGSSHNVHLFRLWSARRFLQVEGDDIPILQGFQNILFPETSAPLAGIPHASFGGWGGWRYALGSSKTLANAAGAAIMTYCILDADYHSLGQIRDVYREFAKHGVQIHVWLRKELENYLLEPKSLARAIESRAPRRVASPTAEEIQGQLEEFAKELQEEAFDAYAQELYNHDRSLGTSGANKAARAWMERRRDQVGLIGNVSGKALLQRFFDWAKKEFGASLNALSVAASFDRSTIPP
ncbi:MAG TPA: AAA family ATPase, partial [Terriglobales bacterium]|nr:AAA family ATPase [Terriglobales bacterium]